MYLYTMATHSGIHSLFSRCFQFENGMWYPVFLLYFGAVKIIWGAIFLFYLFTTDLPDSLLYNPHVYLSTVVPHIHRFIGKVVDNRVAEVQERNLYLRLIKVMIIWRWAYLRHSAASHLTLLVTAHEEFSILCCLGTIDATRVECFRQQLDLGTIKGCFLINRRWCYNY